MIGNDIVDLDLARKESNWQRKGFLEKIFSLEEQYLIHNDSNPEIMVWNLWSRKEAAYKIFNRNTGINGYFPWRLKCHYEDLNSGTVVIGGFVFHTRTQITDSYIYSIAVSEKSIMNKIIKLNSLKKIKKEEGIPYLLDSTSKKKQPVSITHHGRYQKIITLQ